MRLAAVFSALLLAGCISGGSKEAELCEIELETSHSPYLMQFTQSVDASHISTFECALSTQGLAGSSSDFYRLLAPRCRDFLVRATSAASACTGIRFDPAPKDIGLETLEGSDANGPFFGLRGRARRYAP